MVSSIDNGRDFLAHHGVLGMHWGEHKVEPASSGAKANSTNPKPTSEPNHVKVDPHKDTKLNVGDYVTLGATGVAGVGFAGNVGHKSLRVHLDSRAIDKNTKSVDLGKDFLASKMDTSVPMGTVFHRVASTKEAEVNAPKYATYLKPDVLRYRNSWVTPGRSSTDAHYVTKMQARKDVKIASPESIKNIIEKELNNKQANGKTLREMLNEHPEYAYRLSEGGMFKNYNDREMAQAIVGHNRSNYWSDDVGKVTSDLMQKHGYHAVTDINNTGVGTRKHAVIVLDKEAFKVSSHKLGQTERFVAGIAKDRLAKAALRAAAKKL